MRLVGDEGPVLTLIYVAYIDKAMRDNDLYKTYTLQGLLDELDIIERFEHPGHRPHVGEMTKRTAGPLPSVRG